MLLSCLAICVCTGKERVSDVALSLDSHTAAASAEAAAVVSVAARIIIEPLSAHASLPWLRVALTAMSPATM